MSGHKTDSHFIPTATTPVTSLSNSRSWHHPQMTQSLSESSQVEMCLPTEGSLTVWQASVETTTWSSLQSRQWRLLWTSGVTQPHQPPSSWVICQDLKWELNISFLIKKSTSEDVLSAAVKETQPAKVSDGALLFLQHWIHPHLLHHPLVCCCHCQVQRQTAACNPLYWESDWLQSAFSARPVHL